MVPLKKLSVTWNRKTDTHSTKGSRNTPMLPRMTEITKLDELIQRGSRNQRAALPKSKTERHLNRLFTHHSPTVPRPKKLKVSSVSKLSHEGKKRVLKYVKTREIYQAKSREGEHQGLPLCSAKAHNISSLFKLPSSRYQMSSSCSRKNQ